MPQSLVKILVHIVFSTKNRVDLITPEIENGLYGYIHGIIDNNGGKLIIGNGTENHSHLLVSLGCNDVGELIGDIKRNSSLWIKKQGSEFGKFYWQRGYGAFSIGQSQVPDVSDTFGIRKSIIRSKAMRTNSANYVENMMWNLMSDIVGIDLFVAFSDGLCIYPYLGFHSLRSLHPRL